MIGFKNDPGSAYSYEKVHPLRCANCQNDKHKLQGRALESVKFIRCCRGIGMSTTTVIKSPSSIIKSELVFQLVSFIWADVGPMLLKSKESYQPTHQRPLILPCTLSELEGAS